MNDNRLIDYLDHIQQASIDVLSFIDGLEKDDFLEDLFSTTPDKPY